MVLWLKLAACPGSGDYNQACGSGRKDSDHPTIAIK
jgi:hypothetical protein